MRLQQFGRAGDCQDFQVSVVLLDLGIQQQQRRAIARRLVLADASVEVSGPGRKAASRRRSVILPLTWSSCSRRASGEQTIIALSVCMACVLALTAVSRAILR